MAVKKPFNGTADTETIFTTIQHNQHNQHNQHLHYTIGKGWVQQEDKEMENYDKEYIINELETVLRSYGAKEKKGNWDCIPKLHKKSEKGNLSITVLNGRKVCCCHCGLEGDTFNVVAKMENLDVKKQFPDVLRKSAERLRLSNIPLNNSNIKQNKSVEPVRKKKDYSSLIGEWHKNVNETNYFKSRGISQDIINKYKLGYIKNNPIYKDYNYAIPVSNTFVIFRTDKNIDTRYKNTAGSTEILNLKYLKEKDTDIIFFVEGAFDAFSIEEFGYKAISTNSTSGNKKLIEAIEPLKDQLKEKHFIFIPDVDDTGQGQKEPVKKAFNDMGLNLYIADIPEGKGKDCNDYLRIDREEFNSFLIGAIEGAKSMKVKNEGKQAESKQGQNKEAPKEIKKLQISTASDLLKKELKPIEYIIPDILPEQSIIILAGAQKLGKSWLAMDMTLCISEGTTFFNRQTKQSNVLYLDLESGERSLQGRIKKLSKDIPFPDRWKYSQEISPIGEGFKETLEEAIKEHDIKVVVVDVFVRVRSPRGKTQTEYQHDYSDLKVLKELRDKYGVTFLLINHVTKMKYDDDFASITGSVGLTGAADGSIILLRDRFSNEAKLIFTGREIAENQYQIEFNKDTLRWEYISTVEEAEKAKQESNYKNNAVVKAIKYLVEKGNGSWRGQAQEVLETVNSMDLSDVEISSIPTNSKSTGTMINNLSTNLAQEGYRLSKIKSSGKCYLVFKKF